MITLIKNSSDLEAHSRKERMFKDFQQTPLPSLAPQKTDLGEADFVPLPSRSTRVFIPVMAVSLLGAYYLMSLAGLGLFTDTQPMARGTKPVPIRPPVNNAPTSSGSTAGLVSTSISTANLVLLSALTLCLLILCCTCVQMRKYKARLEACWPEREGTVRQTVLPTVSQAVAHSTNGCNALTTPIAGVLQSGKARYANDLDPSYSIRPHGVDPEDDRFFVRCANEAGSVHKWRMNNWQPPVLKPSPNTQSQPVDKQAQNESVATTEQQGFDACLPTAEKQEQWMNLNRPTRIPVHRVLPEGRIYYPGILGEYHPSCQCRECFLKSDLYVQFTGGTGKIEQQRIMLRRQDFYAGRSVESQRRPLGLLKRSVYEQFS